MDKFLVKSDYLKGKNAKTTMESIAYTLAKHYDIKLVEDVLGAIILGLDGGPERYSDHSIYIINNIKENKINIYKESLTLNIRELVDNLEGWFNYDQIDRELGILNKKDKDHRRKVIHRLVDDGVLEKNPKYAGRFQKIVQDVDGINWQDADINQIYNISFPFEIEKRVNIYSRNLIIIAGSPNSGKTALILNIIEMNQDRYPGKINLFSSEMGPEELKLRISKFDRPLESWDFNPYERVADFARVIRPDEINIIDYLEIGDNFFTIADEFRKIFDNLKKGIAIIALQKKTGASMGRGAEFGMEKPRLYLAMDNGVLKIIKAKNWATKDNPNGLEYRFKLVDGCKFITTNVFDNTKEEEEIPF